MTATGGNFVDQEVAVDGALVSRKGYILVEFNPEKDALFPKYDLAGLPHFDILKEHGFFFDVPEEVCDHFLKNLQEIDKDAWRELVHKTDPEDEALVEKRWKEYGLE